MTRMRSTSYICVCVVFPNSETCVQWINPHQLQHKEKWQDSRMTFTTPASASLRTSRPLSTPTSDQLRTADKQRKRRRMVLSTLLSDLTVPVVRQGEQLLSHKNPLYDFWKYTHWLMNCHWGCFIFVLHRTRCQEAGDKLSELYSTVNKTYVNTTWICCLLFIHGGFGGYIV